MNSAPAPAYPAVIPVAIVDDDLAFAEMVQTALECEERFRVIATAKSAEEALLWLRVKEPRVLLLDVGLPGLQGTKAIEHFLRLRPNLLIVMLTARTESDILLEAMSAGAIGYVVKGAEVDDIARAVDDAVAGGAPMSPGIARRVLSLMRPRPVEKTPTSSLSELTPREIEILGLVVEGLADKEIGDRLKIAHPTVKNHLANIYHKWAVRSRTEAAIRFIRIAT